MEMEYERELNTVYAADFHKVQHQQQQQKQVQVINVSQTQQTEQPVPEDQRQENDEFFHGSEPERAWQNFTETVQTIGEFIFDFQPCGMDCSRLEPVVEPPSFQVKNNNITHAIQSEGLVVECSGSGNVQPLYLTTSSSDKNNNNNNNIHRELFPSIHLSDPCECQPCDNEDDSSEDELDLHVNQQTTNSSTGIFGTSTSNHPSSQPYHLSFHSIAQNAGNKTFAGNNHHTNNQSIYRPKSPPMMTACTFQIPTGFPGLTNNTKNFELYRSPAWEDEQNDQDDTISVEYDPSHIRRHHHHDGVGQSPPRLPQQPPMMEMEAPTMDSGTADNDNSKTHVVFDLKDVDEMFQGFSLRGK